jgi:dihydroflavonol-4-reductase
VFSPAPDADRKQAVLKQVVVAGQDALGANVVTEMLERGAYEPIVLGGPTFGRCPALPRQPEELSDDELADLLAGVDALIITSGQDMPCVGATPARANYERYVSPTQRLVRTARMKQVRRVVVFGALEVQLARRWRDLPLSKSPYVRARMLQEEIAVLEGEGVCAVSVIRLPKVFGGYPSPECAEQIRRIQAIAPGDLIPVASGGTAVATARQVAQATIGAMEFGVHGTRYAVVGENLTYRQIAQTMADEIGRNPDDVIALAPEDLARSFPEYAVPCGPTPDGDLAMESKLAGRCAYLDIESVCHALRYPPDDVRAAVRQTVRLSLADVAPADLTSVGIARTGVVPADVVPHRETELISEVAQVGAFSSSGGPRTDAAPGPGT